MTIQECYKEMGGDFEGVQKRFGGAAMVEKFAIKFLSDSSFQDLEDGLKEKDALKIDAVLKGMKCAGNATVVSEVQNESRRYLEYEIDF